MIIRERRGYLHNLMRDISGKAVDFQNSIQAAKFRKSTCRNCADVIVAGYWAIDCLA